MYPHTLASLVKTADGGNVDEGLEKAKFALLVDMWNEAASFGYNGVPCGKYDPENAPDAKHPFYLNELWLTYEEAMLVLTYWSSTKDVDVSAKYMDAKLRTTLFLPIQSVIQCKCRYTFRNCTDLESAAFVVWANDITSMFSNCPKFRRLTGHISLSGDAVVSNAFQGCSELEDVLIYYASKDISFADSPKLSLKTLKHLVANRQGANGFIVVVHPDAYARLTEELIAEAAEKQITFATT